jgi:hypothetical protein
LPRAVPPPATVRPQGLATLSAVYALRAPAGFFSRRRRSWDSPFGAFSSRKVSAAFPRGRTHVPFASSVIPPPKRWAGPTSRGFWVSALPGIPGDRTGINLPATGCSHGLRPSRACRRQPGRGFRPSSSHTLRRPQSFDRSPPASRSLDRRSPGPAAERARRTGTRGQDNPFRVLAPARSRSCERRASRAMGSPCVAPHVAADCPTRCGRRTSLYRSRSGHD